tara:strand:+ start:150 stop:479 length:330 start_codon:yes stop_codon:yes gene_type:complete
MPTIVATQLTSALKDFDADGTAADAGGDQVAARKNLILIFQNKDVSLTTITIAVPGTADGNAIADIVLPVPAGDTALVRVTGGIYADANNFVQITYSSETSLKVIATYL